MPTKLTSVVAAAATLLCFAGSCLAQGTLTLTFQGPPPGQQWQIGVYTNPATGMQFGPLTPQRLYLNGGGTDNGTCYLEIPEGSMRFGFNQFPLTSPTIPFTLLSFDAAEYFNFPPSDAHGSRLSMTDTNAPPYPSGAVSLDLYDGTIWLHNLSVTIP
jgi:hypothetical protein